MYGIQADPLLGRLMEILQTLLQKVSSRLLQNISRVKFWSRTCAACVWMCRNDNPAPVVLKWDASRGRYILPVVHIYIYHDNTLAASASISNFLFNFKHHYCVSKFSTDSVSSSIIIPSWASDRPSTAEYKHTRTCRIIKFSYWTLYLTFWRKILLFINLSFNLSK